MLLDLGVLLSGLFLRSWISWIKRLLLAAILLGIPIQNVGLNAPPEHAGTVILAGIGLVCIGAAAMTGKEAYCSGYREGWAIMWSFPLVIILNFAYRENRIFNTAAFSAIFLLFLSLTGKRLKQTGHPACGRTQPKCAT